MKVLLVDPSTRHAQDTLEGGRRIAPGLMYVAEATKSHGHEVRVVIVDADEITPVLETFAPDVLGVGSMTATYPTAAAIVQATRRRSPRTTTVLGGVHATFLPGESLLHSGADYVVRGEGESSFPMLLDALERGDDGLGISGVCHRVGDECHLADVALLDDIDTLAYPSDELLPDDAVDKPFIFSSRGCPHRCSFCTIPTFYGGRFRPRSVERVVGEIERLQEAGHPHFLFLDDNFTANPTRVAQICDGMLARGIRIQWGCQARVDFVANHPDLVQKMADAGCRSMTIGIESGIAEILDSYNKKITLDQVHEAVRVMETSRIVDFWYFMFGSGDEYDTEDYWRKNADFLLSLDRDLVNVSLMTPYPGTDLYTKLVREDRIIDWRWEHWDAAHCVYRPLHGDPGTLERIFLETLRRHYLHRSPIRNVKAVLRASGSGRYHVRGLLSFLVLIALEGARRRRAPARQPEARPAGAPSTPQGASP